MFFLQSMRVLSPRIQERTSSNCAAQGVHWYSRVQRDGSWIFAPFSASLVYRGVSDLYLQLSFKTSSTNQVGSVKLIKIL